MRLIFSNMPGLSCVSFLNSNSVRLSSANLRSAFAAGDSSTSSNEPQALVAGLEFETNAAAAAGLERAG